MDNTPYLSFFADPTGTIHRRYEALRAVFLDQRGRTTWFEVTDVQATWR